MSEETSQEEEDNLGDLLAQTSEGDNDTPKASPTSGSSRPAPRKPSRGILKPIAAALSFLVGAGLIGYAVYGAMILRGEIEIERENARLVAKVMVFVAGPMGAILLIASLVLAAQTLMHRK